QALASLQIGVNNQYQGASVTAFAEDFRTLLEIAIDAVGDRPGRVLVLTIPDWGVSRFAAAEGHDPATVAAAIDAFNAVVTEQAAARGCRRIDVTGVSRDCGAAEIFLAADGLHPSAAQYQRWLPAI